MKATYGLKLTLLLSFCALAPAQAQEAAYPSKQIRMVVAYAPGGATDVLARKLALAFSDAFGQQVVIENRPGASGNIGSEFVARSRPDGYTLLFAPSTLIANPLVMKDKASFDVKRDLTAISLVASGPLLMIVNPNGPANLREFVAQAKANPAKFNFGTGGFGAAGHLSAEHFKVRAGIPAVPVVLYKGTAPALTDIMGGHLSAMMEPTLSAMPPLRGGKVRALAITSSKRDALFPDVPTFAEAGFPDMEFSTWYGVWGPANLPAAIQKKLADTQRTILNSPDFKAWLAQQGYEPSALAGQDFTNFLDKEAQLYTRIVSDGKIRPQ